MARKQTNKRKAERMDVKDGQVGLELKTAMSFLYKPRGGRLPLINISLEGCQFLSRKRIDEDTVLHMNIDLPAFIDPLFVYGRVMWCESIPRKNKVFRVGVRFEKIRGKGSKSIKAMAEDVQLRQVERAGKSD